MPTTMPTLRFLPNEKHWPLIGAYAVTPSDTDDVTADEGKIPRAIMVSQTCTIKLTMLDDTVVTLTGLAPGGWHPMRVKRVWSTSLTGGTTVWAGY